MQEAEVVVDSPATGEPALIPAAVADDTKTEPPEGEVKAEGEGAQETPEQQEAKKHSKYQRRRQKTARIAAETEARLLREENDRLKAERAPKPQDTGEPKQSDFDDYNEYVRALAKYEAKQEASAALKSEREANAGKEKQGKQQEATQKIADSWIKREAEFKVATPDYEETVTDFVENDLRHFSDMSRRALVESDVGPQLLHYLATHKMQKPAKKASNAPPPPNPVKGGASGSKDPAKMSVDEYKAFMKANGSRYVR